MNKGYFISYVLLAYQYRGPPKCTGKALDLQPKASGFKTKPLRMEDNNLGQDMNTMVPLSTQEYEWVHGQ